ncbi:MAG: 2-phospho-L-lactate transferase CofD family protein, partial [Candidatus Omnitrophota bacterium]
LDKLILLLQKEYPIVIVSDQRYFDNKDNNGEILEAGLESRLVEAIREKTPSLLKYLTIYASAGTFKVAFDDSGREIVEHAFNNRTAMDEAIALEMKENIERIIEEEYWSDYEARPEYYRNIYPTFVFEGHKPEVILHQNGKDIYGISVIYLPSEKVGAYNQSLSEDGQDVRTRIFKIIEAKLSKAIHEYIWADTQYTISMRGVTSIDIRRRHTGKDHALRQHIIDNKFAHADVFFFGNLDEYSEDAPVALVKGINRFANSLKQNKDVFQVLPVGLGSIYYWMDFIAQRSGKDAQGILSDYKSEKAEYPALSAAKDRLRAIKQEPVWLNASYNEKIEQLYALYQNFNLTAENELSWAHLYQEAFELNINTRSALNEVVTAYDDIKEVDRIFAKVDLIYQGYDDIDFVAFYSAIDPRIARNINTILGVYSKLGQPLDDFIRDTFIAAQKAGLFVSRVLAGYYEDGYFFRHKKGILTGLEARGPPVKAKVVYLGGGGKATTTFLQKVIEKGLTKVACIISSSDDGGSSKSIMMNLFKKFGFYFIPPGDAAGLNIFLSNDNFKILTLFWIESNKKELPAYLHTQGTTDKGRISADAVYPIWKERIEKIIAAFSDPNKKVEIEQVIAKVLNEKSLKIDFDINRHLVFLTSILSLGELLDRELVSRGVVELKDMSTANLLLIGDAYDTKILRFGRKIEDGVEQPILHRLLELGDAQPIPVSYDYERSALVACDKEGNIIETTQTRITDKAQNKLIHDLYFSHRTSEEKMKPFSDSDGINYPKAIKKALEAIREAELIIMGNGSLWTSLMPVLMYREVAEALLEKRRLGTPVVFIAKIKSDLETAAKIDVDGNNMLIIGEQLKLIEQLEAIRRHISRAVNNNQELSLKDIFSHVVIPTLDADTVKFLSEVKLKTEVVENIKKGEAQVSKLFEGIQPPVTDQDINDLKEKGLDIGVVSQEHIIGIVRDIEKPVKKPLYNNDYLYKVLSEIAPEAMKSSSPVIAQEFGAVVKTLSKNDSSSPCMAEVISEFTTTSLIALQPKIEEFLEAPVAAEGNAVDIGITLSAVQAEIFNKAWKRAFERISIRY